MEGSARRDHMQRGQREQEEADRYPRIRQMQDPQQRHPESALRLPSGQPQQRRAAGREGDTGEHGWRQRQHDGSIIGRSKKMGALDPAFLKLIRGTLAAGQRGT